MVPGVSLRSDKLKGFLSLFLECMFQAMISTNIKQEQIPRFALHMQFRGNVKKTICVFHQRGNCTFWDLAEL